MAFASFIPAIGCALIWIPASLYLLLTGDWPMALFLALWGTIVVGSIDNILRPILMQGSSSMSTLLIFLSLIGGLQLFGLIGLIYGPIIFALTHVLIKFSRSNCQLRCSVKGYVSDKKRPACAGLGFYRVVEHRYTLILMF
jgi:predicted PurR-regulated permease PerM